MSQHVMGALVKEATHRQAQRFKTLGRLGQISFGTLS
jgi:hypothetical protein